MKQRAAKQFFALATIIALVLGIAVGYAGWLFIGRFEEGVLDVCADQQDAYVQLVLDQINLKENRDDEEIITGILGSLDASTNKYWTFSRDEAMLFVKDVLETNKYKGFTTATYYVSDSARRFLDDLEINKVIHRSINIEDKTYVASGVVFLYGDAEYRLCLLTNRDVLLDNNEFLRAEVNVGIVFMIAVFLMVVGTMWFASRLGMYHQRLIERDATISELSTNVANLNKKLLVRTTYDTKRTLFQESMIRDFLRRIQAKGIAPVTFAVMKCANERAFLEKSQLLLDRGVLRFQLEGTAAHLDGAEIPGKILLVFVRCDHDNAMLSLNFLMNISNQILAVEQWNGNTDILKFSEELLSKTRG